MKNTDPFIKISDSFSEALIKLQKAGGLALVFVFIGLLLTVFSFIYPQSELSLPTFLIGTILILLSFLLFLYTHFNGIVKTRKIFKQSAETLDTLHEMSIDLVDFTKDLQAYCFKNLDKITGTVNAVLPIIKPFLGQKGQDMALKMENITAGIVDISSKTEKVIRDIEKALKENDFKALKKYESDLTKLNEQLKMALKN